MENINNLDPSTLLSPLTCYAIEKTRQDSTSHPESSNKWGCLEGIWPSSKFLLETDSCRYLSGPRKKFCTKDRCDVKTGIRCWPRVSETVKDIQKNILTANLSLARLLILGFLKPSFKSSKTTYLLRHSKDKTRLYKSSRIFQQMWIPNA